MHARERCGPAPPALEDLTQRRQWQRLLRLGGEGLVAGGGDESQHAVLQGEDGIAPGELPRTVGAVPRKRVADLQSPQDAAGRAQQYRRVVLDLLAVRAPAELRARHLDLLASEPHEE